MNNTPLTIVLIGLIATVSFAVIIYWHVATKGTWRKWPAGRSLMGLLGIIAVGFGYGVMNQLIGPYPAKAYISFFLYLAFIGALILIGFTIRKELATGRRRSLDTHTGPIDITVAEEQDSSHD
jgi:hypothetical protein